MHPEILRELADQWGHEPPARTAESGLGQVARSAMWQGYARHGESARIVSSPPTAQEDARRAGRRT
jgi:hypothetical protein